MRAMADGLGTGPIRSVIYAVSGYLGALGSASWSLPPSEVEAPSSICQAPAQPTRQEVEL